MKKITLLKFSLLALTMVLTFSCTGDELKNSDLYQEDAPQSIEQFIKTNNNYSMLYQAIEGSDIQDWLANQDNITLFAPSNQAFELYLSDNGYVTITDVPHDQLKTLIKNHIISNEVLLSGLSANDELLLETNAQTQFESDSYVMAIATTNGTVAKINGIELATQDMLFVNGVVHSVNRIVEPSTAYTFINESKSFESFKTLIGQLEDASSIISALNQQYNTGNSQELTLFAPDNDAVQSFISNLLTTSSDNSADDLLNYVVSTQLSLQDNYEVSEFTTGMVINTLGADLETTVTASNEVSFRTSIFSAEVKLKDLEVNSIQTSNGIVLLTDKVLF